MNEGPESQPLVTRWWAAFRSWPRVAHVVCAALVAVVVLAGVGAASESKSNQANITIASSSATTVATRSEVHPSVAAADQPDRFHPSPSFTPGATFPVTKDEVCVRGYSASVRSVSESTRDEVFRAYGVADADRGDFVIDHLIPLELGGSNDVTNLWPQPHDAATNASVDKDTLENELHDLVCSGEVSLADAQRAIVSWDTIDLAILVSTTTTTTTVPPTTVPPTTLPPASTLPSASLPPVTEPLTTEPPTTMSQTPDCTPGYDPCIPLGGGDVDCAGGKGNGPRYVTGPISVTGSDPYDLDRDHDGVGCE